MVTKQHTRASRGATSLTHDKSSLSKTVHTSFRPKDRKQSHQDSSNKLYQESAEFELRCLLREVRAANRELGKQNEELRTTNISLEQKLNVNLSNQRLAQVFHLSPSLMALSTLHDGRFIEVNESLILKTGFSRKELIGKTSVELGLVSKRVHENVRNKIEREGRVQNLDICLKTKKGNELHCLISAEWLEIDGEQLALFVADDISHHRYVENALSESERRYRTLFENVPNGVYRTTPDGRVIDANPALVRMLGYSSLADLKTRNLNDEYEPNYPREEFCRQIEKNGSVNGIEIICTRKDGSLIHLRESAKAVRDSSGRVIFYEGTTEDISDWVLAKKELQESRERYRTVVETQPELICRHLPNGKLTFINKAYCQYFGKTRRQLEGTSFYSLVPEEEWEDIRNYLDSFTPENHFKTHEHQVVKANGELAWQQWSNCAIFDEQGEIIEFQDVGRDITDRKNAEDELATIKQRLQFILDTSPTVSFSCQAGPEFTLTFISENVKELLGYDTQECLTNPKFWSENIHPEDRKLLFSAFPDSPHTPKRIQEYRFRKKDGFYCWLHEQTSLVVNTDSRLNEMIGTLTDITKRKEAEEALRQSEAKFRGYFEQGLVGMVICSPQARMIEINDKLCDIFGYTREELLLLRLNDITHPEDLPTCSLNFERILSGKSDGFSMEKRFIRKDGNVIYAEMSAKCLRLTNGTVDYCVAVIRDISKRKKAEEALEMTRFSIDRALDSIFWTNKQGKFVDVNDAACRNLGYTREELLSMNVADIDPYFPREERQEHWENVKRNRTLRIESTHLTKNGKHIPVELALHHLEFAGRQYNCAFAHDISLRVRLSEERQRLEDQMQHAQKLESLGLLAGGIAHDFNNILVGIMGNADLALMDLTKRSSARKYVEEVKKASVRASDLTNQMLAYSGKGKFVVEKVHLNKLVEEMTNLVKASISKNVVIRFDFKETLPLVEADVTQLSQVVMNLITNASDAIGNNGGIVKIDTSVKKLEEEDFATMYCAKELGGVYCAESFQPGRFVCLSVSDTGCGMDELSLSKLFDPFYTTKFAGRGLGLSAVLGIVRGHSGAISVSSVPGKGTVFKVFLPACKSALTPQIRKVERIQDRRPWRGSGTVLVVDDEEAVREVAKTMFERAGFEVLTAADGKKGVEIFSRHLGEIKAVLLDMTMPQMSGKETFYALQRISKDVKVVLSSGYSEQDEAQTILESGAVAFVQKPYRTIDLRKAFSSVLEP